MSSNYFVWSTTRMFGQWIIFGFAENWPSSHQKVNLTLESYDESDTSNGSVKTHLAFDVVPVCVWIDLHFCWEHQNSSLKCGIYIGRVCCFLFIRCVYMIEFIRCQTICRCNIKYDVTLYPRSFTPRFVLICD